jgi:hypothetical protein
MTAKANMAGWMGAAAAVLALALSPAFGAQVIEHKAAEKRAALVAQNSLGTFTPAGANPNLAASFARAGLVGGTGFRFTPSATVVSGKRSVTVAVRALSTGARQQAERVASVSPTLTSGISPVAYNLGVSVGWKRFALSGDVAKVDLGVMPGSRQRLDVGVSYNAPRFSTRLQVGKENPIGNQPVLVAGDERTSVDLASSYSLTRRLDVTAGVRYQTQRDRLQLSSDARRDSQAVYIGTAFKF